jgi:hypothetical protein
MQHLDGRIFKDVKLPSLSPKERAAVYDEGARPSLISLLPTWRPMPPSPDCALEPCVILDHSLVIFRRASFRLCSAADTRIASAPF